MDKEKQVLESIKKLIDLKVPEKEIVENLVSIGISEDAAQELIDKVKIKPKIMPREKEEIAEERKTLDLLHSKDAKEKPKEEVKGKFAFKEKKLESEELGEKGLFEKKEEVEKSALGEEEAEVEKSEVEEKKEEFGIPEKKESEIKIPEKTETNIPEKEESEYGLSEEEKKNLLGGNDLFGNDLDELKKALEDEEKVDSELKKKEGFLQDKKKELNKEDLEEKESLEKKKGKELFPKENLITGKEVKKEDFWDAEDDEKLEKEIKKAFERKKGDGDRGESIWKEGILETVDVKLDEMKRLRDEIESLMEKKIEGIVDKEISKMKVLMESERDLTKEQINSVLEEKADKIDEEFVGKVKELKDLLMEIKVEKNVLDGESAQLENKLEAIKNQIEDSEKLKESLLNSYTEESGKLLKKFENEVSGIREIAKAIEKRASITLNLQQKIAEGLESNVKNIIANKVQEAVLDIKKEYEDSLQDVINREKKEGEKIRKLVEGIEEFKKKELEVAVEEFRKIGDRAEKRIEDNLTDEFTKKIKTMFRGKGMKSEVKEAIKESVIDIVKDEVKNSVNNEVIGSVIEESVMKELSSRMKKADEDLKVLKSGADEVLRLKQEREDFAAFEEQFSATIKKNRGELEQALEKWKNEVKGVEERADMKIRAIDNSIKKMERFEKELAEILEELVKRQEK